MAALVLVVVAVAAPTHADWSGQRGDSGEWQPFASLRDQTGNQLVVLEWMVFGQSEWDCLPPDCHWREATWRVTNHTTEELFWLKLGARSYSCRNGYSERKSSAGLGKRILRPGAKVRLTSSSEADGRAVGYRDQLDSSECSFISEAAFDSAAGALRFAIRDDKPVKPWTDYGPVTLDE